MSKRRHNFGTKRFKEKSLFIFHARIALKSLILLFVRLIARGARIGKTHTHTHTHTHTQTDKTSTVTLAHARRGLIIYFARCMYTESAPNIIIRMRMALCATPCLLLRIIFGLLCEFSAIYFKVYTKYEYSILRRLMDSFDRMARCRLARSIVRKARLAS